MMKVIANLATVLMFLFLVSCTKDYFEQPAPPQSVSFSKDVIPIFNNNCISCHSGSVSPNLTADKAYGELTGNPNLVVPGNPDGSGLYHRVMGQGSMMPPSGMMPNIKTDVIYEWIKDGALNN